VTRSRGKQVMCLGVMLLALISVSALATDQPQPSTCCRCTPSLGFGGCECTVGPCTCQLVIRPDASEVCTCECGAAKHK
jgi:hypothetical protein